MFSIFAQKSHKSKNAWINVLPGLSRRYLLYREVGQQFVNKYMWKRQIDYMDIWEFMDLGANGNIHTFTCTNIYILIARSVFKYIVNGLTLFSQKAIAKGHHRQFHLRSRHPLRRHHCLICWMMMRWTYPVRGVWMGDDCLEIDGKVGNTSV